LLGLGCFFCFLIPPRTRISPLQSLFLHTGQRKHRLNTHTDIRASCGTRTHYLNL
jgi:hypothetical protein